MSNVTLAASAGFCFGVKRAIEMAYAEIEKNDGTPLYSYGSLIHNKEVTRDLDEKGLHIIESLDGIEVWDEIAKNGSVIRFKTARKEPFSLYEFDIIKGNGFTGHWKGELQETSTGGTHFTSTETIRMKNPFLKVLSYLFFDIEKFMDNYQNDLRVKLSEDLA